MLKNYIVEEKKSIRKKYTIQKDMYFLFVYNKNLIYFYFFVRMRSICIVKEKV